MRSENKKITRFLIYFALLHSRQQQQEATRSGSRRMIHAELEFEISVQLRLSFPTTTTRYYCTTAVCVRDSGVCRTVVRELGGDTNIEQRDLLIRCPARQSPSSLNGGGSFLSLLCSHLYARVCVCMREWTTLINPLKRDRTVFKALRAQ